MPKRFGYVWEEVVSLENCEQAILDALENKKKTPYLRHIKDEYKKYGAKIRAILLEGWQPKPIRTKTINEGTNKKKRDLKIPPLFDHFIHTAVARVLKKYLQPKFYYYASGSIPNKGQTFSKCAIETMLKRYKPTYAAQCDVKKFYDSAKAEVIMSELKRIFKDKKFLDLIEKILHQMSDVLAIGFTLSHWFAHMLLMRVDHMVKEKFPQVRLVRSMDNFVLMGDSKEELHDALKAIRAKLHDMQLEMKGDWQVFPLQSRPIEFLSYRHYLNRTVLRKALMLRIIRRVKRLKPNARNARTIMSYLGIIKHFDSYNFKQKYIYSYINIENLRRLISNADKKRLLFAEA